MGARALGQGQLERGLTGVQQPRSSLQTAWPAAFEGRGSVACSNNVRACSLLSLQYCSMQHADACACCTCLPPALMQLPVHLGPHSVLLAAREPHFLEHHLKSLKDIKAPGQRELSEMLSKAKHALKTGDAAALQQLLKQGLPACCRPRVSASRCI